ncbi:hypothetical protein B0J14DRAFT_568009 [Halenospora varia]|nr:hypothetical protein B0J14DRAFT_568009 [Halenospora varia]
MSPPQPTPFSSCEPTCRVHPPRDTAEGKDAGLADASVPREDQEQSVRTNPLCPLRQIFGLKARRPGAGSMFCKDITLKPRAQGGPTRVVVSETAAQSEKCTECRGAFDFVARWAFAEEKQKSEVATARRLGLKLIRPSDDLSQAMPQTGRIFTHSSGTAPTATEKKFLQFEASSFERFRGRSEHVSASAGIKLFELNSSIHIQGFCRRDKIRREHGTIEQGAWAKTTGRLVERWKNASGCEKKRLLVVNTHEAQPRVPRRATTAADHADGVTCRTARNAGQVP